MPQTGQEPPEKAETAREWGEIIPVNTSEVVCSTAFYHSRNTPIKENSLDHLGQKAVI